MVSSLERSDNAVKDLLIAIELQIEERAKEFLSYKWYNGLWWIIGIVNWSMMTSIYDEWTFAIISRQYFDSVS